MKPSQGRRPESHEAGEIRAGSPDFDTGFPPDFPDFTRMLVEAMAELLNEAFEDRLWDLERQWSYFDFDILRGGKVAPRPKMGVIDNT
jgi:hypothetical protein